MSTYIPPNSYDASASWVGETAYSSSPAAKADFSWSDPASSVIQISWVGAVAYTPPNGLFANVSWYVSPAGGLARRLILWQ